MGARKAAGIAVTLLSLLTLAYVFAAGLANGMIGCAKPVLQLTIKTGDGAKTCIVPGAVACDSRSLAAEKARLAKLGEEAKQGKLPAECGVEGEATSYKVVVTPVDSSIAVATVAAWMGLLVGPWLAFGERPSSINPR